MSTKLPDDKDPRPEKPAVPVIKLYGKPIQLKSPVELRTPLKKDYLSEYLRKQSESARG